MPAPTAAPVSVDCSGGSCVTRTFLHTVPVITKTLSECAAAATTVCTPVTTVLTFPEINQWVPVFPEVPHGWQPPPVDRAVRGGA